MLGVGDVSYTRDQAKKLAYDIRQARPDLVVEEFRDFGFSVDVVDMSMPRMVVACQPNRPELNQCGVFRDLAFINKAFPKF